MEIKNLRDQFAIHALGKLAFKTEKEGTSKWIAEKCYEIADAMLIERENHEHIYRLNYSKATKIDPEEYIEICTLCGKEKE